MIAGNSENIALVIETQSKLEGLLAARMGVKDLGGQIQATAEQSRKAWAASGADMSRFATELAKVTTGQKVATAGTVQLTGSVDRMSPRIRTAANAASMLAFSAQGFSGSAQSAAIAAGTLTTSLAGLATSARVAATASGIGAIVVVLSSIIGMFVKARAESKKTVEDITKDFDNLGRGQLVQQKELAQAAAAASAQEAENLRTRATAMAGVSAQMASMLEKQARLADAESIAADIRATKFDAEIARFDKATSLRDEEIRQGHLINSITSAAEERFRASGQAAVEYAAKVKAAMADFGVFQAGAGSRVGTMATQQAGGNLGMNLPADIMAPIPITPINAAGDAVITLGDKFDILRSKVWLAGDAMRDTMLASIQSVTRGGESAIKALKRLALEPIVKHLEGIAAEQAVEALKAAASLNAPKALLHGAAAAAAVGAARKVASLAGLSSGASGGGGYGGSGGGNVGTFRPSYGASGGGNQTVNIIVRDANDRDSIAETIYNVSRAGTLNVAGLPPTRGVDVRVA